jgi:hypothetical protein
MDNKPNLNSNSNSIMQSINETINNLNSNNGSNNGVSSLETVNSTSDNGGLFSYLSSISMTTWIIILIVLAFLGFNIFVYLAKGSQDITNFFTPIIEKILGAFGMATTQVIDTSATGAKGLVNTTADVIDTGLTSVQNALPEGKKASTTAGGTSLQNSIPQADVMQNNTLNKALNNSNVKNNIGQTEDYEADDTSSSIQKGQSKGGYCYIGEERGYRSCMQVDTGDMCMSGQIFPTQEICVNPSLRA